MLRTCLIRNDEPCRCPRRGIRKPEDDLEYIINVYVLANTAHLTQTKDAGKGFLAESLKFKASHIKFTQRMIAALSPFIVEEELLPKDSTEWQTAKLIIPISPELFAKYFTRNSMFAIYEKEMEKVVVAKRGGL